MIQVVGSSCLRPRTLNSEYYCYPWSIHKGTRSVIWVKVILFNLLNISVILQKKKKKKKKPILLVLRIAYVLENIYI